MKESSSNPQERMAEAVLRYSSYLDLAAPYLVSRGITQETAIEFRLGYVADPFPAHRLWEGRICLPYSAADGSVSNIKARCVEAHDCSDLKHPKYMGESNIDPALYNVTALLSNDEVLYVTEGEMDCIILHQMGLAAVGYAGTNSWRTVFNRAIGPDWDRIVVVADGDTPGREAAKRVAKELSAEVLDLPDGEDVGSLYVRHGEQFLRQYMGITNDAETVPF